MKTVLRFICGTTFPLLLGLAAPAQSLDELQRGFMTKYDSLNVDRDTKLDKLSGGYQAALKRLMEEMQKTGKLDAVLVVRDEVTALATGKDPLPDLPPNTPDRLKPLRAKYVEARVKIQRDHARELVSLAEKMQALLAEKEKELTKAGSIDDALAAKRMRESLAEDQGIAKAGELLGAGGDPQGTGVPGLRWISLAAVPFDISKSGQYYVGPLEGGEGKGERYAPFIGWITEKAEKLDKKGVLVMIPPAQIQFRLPQTAAEFKGTAILGYAGNVTFRVRAGGKVVAEKTIKGGNSEPVTISCKFPNTRQLTLEVDENGDVTGDCAAWLEAEVR